ESLGVHRLEARAAVPNGRGNGALQKLGAVQEGVLRRSFLCRGRYLDQALFALLAPDWRTMRRPMPGGAGSILLHLDPQRGRSCIGLPLLSSSHPIDDHARRKLMAVVRVPWQRR